MEGIIDQGKEMLGAWMQQGRELAPSLITERCAKLLLDDFNFEDVPCVKLAASKLVGIAIVCGAAIMKLPQIWAILPGNTDGLSLPRFVIETVTFTVIAAYNYVNDYPFSTWGENAFLLVQNYIIVLLILLYRKQLGIVSLVGIAAYVYATWMILSGNLAKMTPFSLELRQSGSLVSEFALSGPNALENYLWMQTIILNPLSRVLQIYKSFSEGSTGNLSFITSFLAAVGACVRLLTVMEEVDDVTLQAAVAIAAALNTIILFQIIYYNTCGGTSGKKLKTE